MKKDVIIGSLLATITILIIFYSIIFGKSIPLIILGFIIYILPFTFMSSFKTTTMAFILVFFSLFVGYIILTYQWYDLLIGILLAAIIGGSVFYLRIYPYKPFSAESYKKMAIIGESDKYA